MSQAIRSLLGIWTGLIVALNSMPVAAQQTGSGQARTGPIIFLTLLVAGALFLANLNFKSNQPFGFTRVTSMPGRDILERLVGRYTVKGWMVSSHTDRGITLMRRSEPSAIITLLLFLFGIVPGLLYLFLGGRDLTIAVNTRDVDEVATEVEIVGNGRAEGSYRIAREVLDSLP